MSVETMSPSEILEAIEKSDILEKIMSGDAVLVNDYGFCRYFVFEDDNHEIIVEQLQEAVSGDAIDVEDLLESTILEVSYVDDSDYSKYEHFISMRQILEGNILENGVIEFNEPDSPNDKTSMKFYKITAI